MQWDTAPLMAEKRTNYGFLAIAGTGVMAVSCYNGLLVIVTTMYFRGKGEIFHS